MGAYIPIIKDTRKITEKQGVCRKNIWDGEQGSGGAGEKEKIDYPLKPGQANEIFVTCSLFPVPSHNVPPMTDSQK